MPSQILHTLFGEDVIQRLSTTMDDAALGKELCALIQRQSGFFSLGCQGPDIFYHNQLSRPLSLEYGGLLHRRGFGDFAADLLFRTAPKYAESGIGWQDESLSAYALGFMTHAFLDRALHPYIIYKTYAAGNAWFGSHAFFERIIDSIMVAILRKKSIVAWDQDAHLAEPCRVSRELSPGGLSGLLTESLIQCIPEKAQGDARLACRIQNALKDCQLYYSRTNPHSPYTRDERIHSAYAYPRRFSLAVDYLNLAHRPWYDSAAAGEGDTRSLPEQYADALGYAALTLCGFMGRSWREGAFPQEAASEALGNWGLSFQAAAQVTQYRSDPLPLEEIFLSAAF